MIKKFIIIASLLFTTTIAFGNVNDSLLGEEQAKDGNELVTNIQDLVQDLKSTRLGKVSDIFVSITTLLICIGAICTISTKTISAALRGEVVKLETLLYPFIFAIIIGSYQPVTQGVDWCINAFDGLIVTLGKSSLQEIQVKREKKSKLIEKIEKKMSEDHKLSMFDQISGALSKFKSWITYSSIQFFTYCASFLTKLVGAVLSIIFYVIGPIAIALSVIPAFADNWKNWLAKYVWVQLFSPMCRIISWILQEVELLILNADIRRLQYCYDNIETTRGGIDITGGSFMEGTAYLGFMVAGGILFITVPSIASWIVNTSGGGVMTGMNAMGTLVMSKTSKIGKEAVNSTYQQGKGVMQKGREALKGKEISNM